MFIQVEETPNPETLKFLPGQTVLDKGTAEFVSAKEAERSPLALSIFDLEGIDRVFFGQDFISVTKTSERDWMLIKPRILGAIMQHYSSGAPLIKDLSEHAEKSEGQPEGEVDNELTRQIKELLDTRVRPAVAMDGGDIVFHSFDDGVLYLKMQGACAGCPSSTATLKTGIENMMRHFVPEVLEVRPIEQ